MKYSEEFKRKCVEMYREGRYPETPEWLSDERFHKTIREWIRYEEARGPEALGHKNHNSVWTAEDKYELVAKVLADQSCFSVAISAGIDSGLFDRVRAISSCPIPTAIGMVVLYSKKQVNLFFDEWNVWYHSNKQDIEVWKREKWGRALLLEDVNNFEDALLVGSMLITFLRNADRVKIACLAQLVNVIAPIMTENGGPAWAQTIFWPYMQVSNYGRGTALRAIVDTPVYDCSDYEGVPLIDATATVDDDGTVTVFCVNRDMSEDFELDIDLRSFEGLTLKEHILLHHDDVKAVNTKENPNNVFCVRIVLLSGLDNGWVNTSLSVFT